VDYELEESSDTVTVHSQYSREKELSFEISEFIPSDALLRLILIVFSFITINNPPTTFILLIDFSNG
jgi:hypothetical protein